jgi:pimeloyl-ACP methyl ester carboxylesterase
VKPAVVYGSIEAAIKRSVGNPQFPKTKHTAAALVARSAVQKKGSTVLTESMDPRIYAGEQALGMDEGILHAFLASIACPVLAILAADHYTPRQIRVTNSQVASALKADGKDAQKWKAMVHGRHGQIKELHVVNIPGTTHHLHADNADQVQAAVFQWLSENPAVVETCRGPPPTGWHAGTGSTAVVPHLPVFMKQPTTNAGSGVESVIPVMGLQLAVKRWEPPGGTKDAPWRVLCWPGSLDNAGSFDLLAPVLAKGGFAVVSVDPPGCGHSEHYRKDIMYHDLEECGMVMAVAEQLQWDDDARRLILLGHSRGSVIIANTASAFADKVAAVVMLDSTFGGLISDFPPPAQMRAAFDAEVRYRQRAPSTFASVEDAVAKNIASGGAKTVETATNIVTRNLKHEASLVLAHDIRTYGRGLGGVRLPLGLTEAAQQEALRNIRCPVLHVASTQFTNQKQLLLPAILSERKSQIKNLTDISAEGGHHVHSDAASVVAGQILAWAEQLSAQEKVPLHPTHPSSSHHHLLPSFPFLLPLYFRPPSIHPSLCYIRHAKRTVQAWRNRTNRTTLTKSSTPRLKKCKGKYLMHCQFALFLPSCVPFSAVPCRFCRLAFSCVMLCPAMACCAICYSIRSILNMSLLDRAGKRRRGRLKWQPEL